MFLCDGAAVAKPGQTRRTQDQRFDELSFPIGVRRFDSCPPHHNPCPRTFFAQEIYNTIDGMRKELLADTTIKNTVRRLKMLAKQCDLYKPEEITNFLANKKEKCKNSYLETIAFAYLRFCKHNNIEWQMPNIKRTSQPPYVPTTEETTILISNSGTKYSLILSMFRDGGFRPIEMQRMKLNWLDLERGIVNVETAKYGLGRTLKLKDSTLAMLKGYVRKNNFKLNDNIFPSTKTMRTAYCKIRARTAKKLKMPQLKRITLYSFRHYFGTTLYYKTKCIITVKEQMGHKNIKNTLVYMHLISFKDDEFVSATAKTVEEACKLIEVGFEYVTELEGVKLFRKRK